MDRLNRSMESTHIGKAEASASASAMANNVNMFDSDLLMAIMQGKPVEKCDSGSDNEAEDKISEDASAQDDASSRNDTAINDKLKKAQKEKNHGRKAFKKKDYENAFLNYIKAMTWTGIKVFDFLTEQAQVAEERKKWFLCYMLCMYITYLLKTFEVLLPEWGMPHDYHMLEKYFDWDELRARRCKALRRSYGLGEEFDEKFLKTPAGKRADELCRRLLGTSVQGSDIMTTARVEQVKREC